MTKTEDLSEQGDNSSVESVDKLSVLNTAMEESGTEPEGPNYVWKMWR